MNLDDLKRQWEARDRKLDALIHLNTRLLEAPRLDKAESTMKRLSWWLRIELLVNIGLALALGSFMAAHAAEPRFLVSAAVLDLFVIALMIAGIRQLAATGSLDYGAPILAVQKRLESLRIERIRATKITLLFAPLLWTPLLIVALKGLLGLNAFAIFPAGWLAANVLFGLAVIPAAIWISRRYAERMERSPLVQRLMRDMGGYNLSAAAGFLSSLERFEEK